MTDQKHSLPSVKRFSISLSEINELQTTVMVFISQWVKLKKTCVPQKEILLRMQGEGVANSATIYALQALLRKGYIKRAELFSNRTAYVQLRTIHV